MCKCPKNVIDIDDLCEECQKEYDKYLENLIEQMIWGQVELEEEKNRKNFIWKKGGAEND